MQKCIPGLNLCFTSPDCPLLPTSVVNDRRGAHSTKGFVPDLYGVWIWLIECPKSCLVFLNFYSCAISHCPFHSPVSLHYTLSCQRKKLLLYFPFSESVFCNRNSRIKSYLPFFCTQIIFYSSSLWYVDHDFYFFKQKLFWFRPICLEAIFI